MKKRYIVLAGIVLALATGIVLLLHSRAHKETPQVPQSLTATSGTFCYERSVAATKESPYAVHESVKLTFDGAAISGTKSGTQSGPDMTNGYEGVLSGIQKGDTLSFLYRYTIEGSHQIEAEEYVLRGGNLIKHRYPLMQEGEVLAPDKTQPFIEQVYERVDCV